ncbi:MAG: SDR family oxidoreductase [Bryobacteraceae bacterium]
MQQFLSGHKALVTGGSKGIGLEIARALAGSGADVVICSRSQKSLDQALIQLKGKPAEDPPPGRIVSHVTDVGSSEQVGRLFEFIDREFGGLDILINNAGSGFFRPVSELTVEEWDRTIGTNLSGAFYCSREAVHRFQPKGGWIINISSLAGKNPFAGGAAYNASKFGLNGFSEALMLDHRHDNVRVSYIMPGSVDTEFNGHVQGEGSEWKIAPEDVAEIALDILRKPARTLVSRVEVRPSRPPKK